MPAMTNDEILERLPTGLGYRLDRLTELVVMDGWLMPGMVIVKGTAWRGAVGKDFAYQFPREDDFDDWLVEAKNQIDLAFERG